MVKVRGFYPILDLDLALTRGLDPVALVSGLAALREQARGPASLASSSRIPLVQLRAKRLAAGEFLRQALAAVAAAEELSVIVNDRLDVAQLSGAAGLHLGQTDLPPAAARRLLGAGRVLGYSTHSLAQAQEALAAPGLELSYLAIGPIFPTRSKPDHDPIVGLDAIRQIRRHYAGPLVAIGGITCELAPSVWATGADAVAVIGGWLDAPDPLARAREYMLAFDRFCSQSGRESGSA